MKLFRNSISFAPFLFLLIVLGFLIDIYVRLNFNCHKTHKSLSDKQSTEISKNIHKEHRKEHNENPLDDCYHVYLDVGSNIGIQIRKLFEPSRYPDASVHSIFDLNFGTSANRLKEGNQDKVCAIGFEPNFQHTKYLKELEKAYNQCGWKVKIFTETAVSDHNGKTNFYFSR